VVVSVVVAAGCSLVASGPESGEATGEIFNGWKDSDFKNVVRVQTSFDNSKTGCSGTLIAPEVVLTAAHCLTGRDVATMRVSFADDDRFSVGVVAALPHPSYRDGSIDHDLALLRLVFGVNIVPPRPKFASVTSSDIGRPVRIVGFGDRVSGSGLGERRSGVARLSTVKALDLEIETVFSNLCFGDSGGAAFFQQADGRWLQVGVHAAILGGALCGQLGYEARIDVDVAGFIEPFLAASEVCPRDGETCDLEVPCGPEDTPDGRCEVPLGGGDPELVYCDEDGIVRYADCAQIGRTCGPVAGGGADCLSGEAPASACTCGDECSFCACGTEDEASCPAEWYGAGDGCDCGCGWDDPDCL
jgi:hypothetical protein